MILGSLLKPTIRAETVHSSASVFGYPRTSSSTGLAIDEDIALSFSAVWAAHRVISETVASLPAITYERMEA